MDNFAKKESLKDIVLKEDATSEDIKQGEIAALKTKIEYHRRIIEDLQAKNHKKKIAIIWLSIVVGLLMTTAIGVAVDMCNLDGKYTSNLFGIGNIEQTTTQTMTENYEHEDEIEKQASSNNSDAQYILAMRYYSGIDGYQEDKVQAMEWLTRSANNGNIKAMMFLAQMYEMGDGIEKNNQTAFKYYFTATRQEDKEALYKVGKYYYEGLGVDKNEEKAIIYLNKSADLNYSPAKALLDIIKQNNVHQQQNTETSTEQ